MPQAAGDKNPISAQHPIYETLRDPRRLMTLSSSKEPHYASSTSSAGSISRSPSPRSASQWRSKWKHRRPRAQSQRRPNRQSDGVAAEHRPRHRAGGCGDAVGITRSCGKSRCRMIRSPTAISATLATGPAPATRATTTCRRAIGFTSRPNWYIYKEEVSGAIATAPQPARPRAGDRHADTWPNSGDLTTAWASATPDGQRRVARTDLQSRHPPGGRAGV